MTRTTWTFLVEAQHPHRVIQWSSDQGHQAQRITVSQAMKICTVNGAYASMEENIKGSITPGKLADLVMLAADPHDTAVDEIKKIPVLRTIVGGRTVYEA